MRPAWSPDSRCHARQPLTYASFSREVTMSDLGYFKTHRTWEDWLGMLLGVLIVLSPWFPMQGDREIVDAERSFVILNTFTVGLLVFGLAQLEYVALQRWEEVAEIALGLWLIASPYIFGYSGAGLATRRRATTGMTVSADLPRLAVGGAPPSDAICLEKEFIMHDLVGWSPAPTALA